MTTLGRLNLHLPQSTQAQRGAWQRHVVSALGYADLTPRSLPPRAILIVRRLDDPLPGALLSGESWQAGQRWGSEARTEIERKWRVAARPAHDPVPADAAAVWFADLAEWLACLSLDLYYGVAHLRWWWQTRLNAPSMRTTAYTLSAVWQAEAQWLPAALAYLHEHSAVPVTTLVGKLPSVEQRAVQQAVLQVHYLPSSVLEGFSISDSRLMQIPGVDKIAYPSPETRSATLLLLAAHYAPAALRHFTLDSDAIAQSEQAKQQIFNAVESPEIPHDEAQPVPAKTHASPTPIHPFAVELTHMTPSDSAESSTIKPQPADAQNVPASDGRTPLIEQGVFAPPVSTERTLSEPAKEAPQPDTPVALPEMYQPDGVITALGGVWFLINLLVMLDLLENGYSAWRKLEVLARHLLIDPPDDDPLWAALAELAGQEHDAVTRIQAQAWLSESWPRIEVWLLEHLESLDQLALVKPARMFLTRTHVDIVFHINDINLPLRLIGLDRDPGWVPHLARVVAFHFE